MELAGKHVHFMGIGGIGVSALAEMARSAGATVSGCDRAESALTLRLAEAGVPVAVGHHPDHVADADLLVYSSAIPDDHPERRAAARQVKRGQFLAELMAERDTAVGVSGTHGKTTTSWLLAHLAMAGGLDPTVFIGGLASTLPGGNHRIGSGPFVAELDESDASFLLPRLAVAVITNIESDHLSHYRSDERLFDAFRRFAAGVADRGLLVAGVDNPEAAAVFASHPGRKLSFGFGPGADLRALAVETDDTGSGFRLIRGASDLGAFRLPLPGRHNIQNALAALAAAGELGVDIGSARAALAEARGVERRMEFLGRVRGASLYSDYAHHPTEVTAAMQAARQLHAGPVLVAFQPHLYSRTRDYAPAFAAALAAADAVLLVDIYPAREEPLPGVDAGLILASARKTGNWHGPVPVRECGAAVRRLAGDFEAVVMMGAGDIDDAARDLAAGAGTGGRPRKDDE